MKTNVVFAITSLVLAGLCFALWTKNQSLHREVAAVQAAKQAAPPIQTTGESKTAQLQEENSRLRQQLGDMQMDLANTQAASNRILLAQQGAKGKPDGAKSGGKGMPGFLKDMMSDPEMRKAVMQQQRMGLDMVYGPMIKDLKLSTEEGDKLKELLLNKQMDMMSLVGDGKADALSPENQKKVADQQKESDAKIKELLGDDRYAQYQDYSQTIGERMALNQFASQNSSITPDQKDQLLNIIKEEKKQIPGAASTTTEQAIQGLKAMQSEDAMEKMLQQQIDMNARVLERSRAVLSPEQVDQLGTFQTNQINMQRMGIKMAQKMMAPADSTAAPTPVPVEPR